MNVSRRCVVCRRETERMACTGCQERMDGQLADVLEFYALASGELLPGSGSGRGTERGLGVRLAALDFLAGNDVVAILGQWEKAWREDRPEITQATSAGRVTVTLSEVVRFLRTWLPDSCDNDPAIDEFARELRECWGIARSAARMSPGRSNTISCPADDDTHSDGICGKRIHFEAEEAKGSVYCPRCHTAWNVLHLMHVAISTPGAEFWADPEAAAAYFSVDTSTLRRWAGADRIRRDHGRYEMHSIHAAVTGNRASAGA